jgi:hypothetical protein
MIVVFSEHFNSSEQVDREIELASEEKKPILTFRVQNTAFTGAKKYYLKNLNWIDAFPNPESFFGDLCNNVQKLLPNVPVGNTPLPPEPQTETIPAQCFLKIRSNLDCNVYVDEEFKLKAIANKLTKLPLSKGAYWLEFVGLENEQDRFAREYTITDSDELLSVDLESVKKERVTKLELVSYKNESGKYGFKDKATGAIIIQARFDDLNEFFEDWAVVKLNGKYGFIDKDGKEVIPLKYEYARNFSEGLATVELNGKWGYIDKTGTEVIPVKYENAFNFNKGTGIVGLNGKYGFIDKAGKGFGGW